MKNVTVTFERHPHPMREEDKDIYICIKATNTLHWVVGKTYSKKEVSKDLMSPRTQFVFVPAKRI